jgi:uncharacterized protein (TIGR00297 family)
LLGLVALGLGGWGAAAMLFAFVTASNLLGRPTRRSAGQVLANGLAPVLGLALSPAFFLGALATATADTLASEVGARAPWAWRPDRGRVKSGTNAAVSPRGSTALVLAALAFAAFSPLFGVRPLPVFVGGVTGAVADTLIGLWLEERYPRFTNDHTNALATLIGGLTAHLLR